MRVRPIRFAEHVCNQHRFKAIVERNMLRALAPGTLTQLGARAFATDLEQFLEHLRWNLGRPARLGGGSTCPTLLV